MSNLCSKQLHPFDVDRQNMMKIVGHILRCIIFHSDCNSVRRLYLNKVILKIFSCLKSLHCEVCVIYHVHHFSSKGYCVSLLNVDIRFVQIYIRIGYKKHFTHKHNVAKTSTLEKSEALDHKIPINFFVVDHQQRTFIL